MSDPEIMQRISIFLSVLDVICLTTGTGFACVAWVTEDRLGACTVKDDTAFVLKPGEENKKGRNRYSAPYKTNIL